MKKLFIILFLLFINGIASATVPVKNAYTNVAVSVCTPSDINTNCRGSGSSSQWLTTNNVGIGTYDNVGIGTTLTERTARLAVIGGNVGIGTTNPAYLLNGYSAGAGEAVMLFQSQSGNARIVAAGDTSIKVPTISLFDTNQNSGTYNVNYSAYIGLDRSLSTLYGGQNDMLFVNAFTGRNMYFVTQTGTQGTKPNNIDMTILSGGNVGIGSSNPGTKLDVNGSIRSTTGGFVFPDATTQTTAATASPNYWVTGNVGINTTNNVGLGSTNPQAKLVIVGTGTTSATNSLMIMDSSFNAKVTINDIGNVGIGTINAGAMLDVSDGIRSVKGGAVGVGACWCTTPPKVLGYCSGALGTCTACNYNGGGC